MIDGITLLCYLMLAASIALPGLGVALGQGFFTGKGIRAVVQQPYAYSPLMRTLLFALALSETSSLLSTVIGLLVLIGGLGSLNTFTSAAALGALALSGFAVGRYSAGCGRSSLQAIAQNPQFAPRIMSLMLLNLSLLQTPYILVLISAWFALQQSPVLVLLPDDLRWTAALIIMGLSSLGPIRGIARFAQASADALMRIPQHAGAIVTFTFVSQAIIETPILFALILALLLMSYTVLSSTLAGIVVCITALSFAISCFVTCEGTSRTASAAVRAVAQHPTLHADMLSTSVGTQALIDTNVIYALLVSLSIILRIT